jgi:hypothetical protein
MRAWSFNQLAGPRNAVWTVLNDARGGDGVGVAQPIQIPALVGVARTGRSDLDHLIVLIEVEILAGRAAVRVVLGNAAAIAGVFVPNLARVGVVATGLTPNDS